MNLSSSKLFTAFGAGIGATLVMDATAYVIKRTRGTKSLDYRLVGRWIGHVPSGVFVHENITTSKPVDCVRELGWAAHYLIGTGISVAFVAAKPSWLDKPTLTPALAVGLATVTAPWFVMQPAFGFGVAAAKTPDPTASRLGSVRAHSAYGVGLWLTARSFKALEKAARPNH